MMTVMCCRLLPSWERIGIARYLANLFSCDVDSLPTDLLIHKYWTSMPREFLNAGAYVQCLRKRRYMVRPCQNINPFYCGRHFGEHAAVDRLSVCRQLLSGGRDTVTNYTVPMSVRTKIARYRACLTSSRFEVAVDSPFYILHLQINAG